MVALYPPNSTLNPDAGRASWELLWTRTSSDQEITRRLASVSVEASACQVAFTLRSWPPTVHADRVGGHLALSEGLHRRKSKTPSLRMRCICPAARSPGTQGAQY